MKHYKILLLSLALLFATQTAWAQTTKKEQRKIERAEKKRLKEEARLRKQEMMLDLVKDQTYVLEANTLRGRYHQIQVNPSTNFVQVRGNQVIIQTANDFRVGYNGLGGITINGTIRDYRIFEEKNGLRVFIQFTDPVLGLSSLSLNIQNSGLAEAMVQGNWGSRAIFQGQFLSPEDSRVFKGQSII